MQAGYHLFESPKFRAPNRRLPGICAPPLFWLFDESCKESEANSNLGRAPWDRKVKE
jgi:hypothetical protein